MSKWKIQFFENRKFSPISYWVHTGIGEETLPYVQRVKFSPPFPSKDPNKGFPFLMISILGFEFEFASLLELEHCINTLSQKNLPTTTELSNKRGTGYGPNNH